MGCADGFGTRIVKQHVDKLDAIDFDDLFIENAIKTNSDEWPITFFSHNILDAPINNNYDGIMYWTSWSILTRMMKKHL